MHQIKIAPMAMAAVGGPDANLPDLELNAQVDYEVPHYFVVDHSPLTLQLRFYPQVAKAWPMQQVLLNHVLRFSDYFTVGLCKKRGALHYIINCLYVYYM